MSIGKVILAALGLAAAFIIGMIGWWFWRTGR